MTASVSSLPSASSAVMSSPSDGVGAAMVRACTSNCSFRSASFALALASASAKRLLGPSAWSSSASGHMERELPAVAAAGDTGAGRLSRNRYVVPLGSSHFA